ncbi:MAG: hypothetical protein A2Z72_01535 [Omnitrophica bacterium RBG_13_46_9]|nr:MAG: hypothetical protein A2Z72_01535 [Omnitrophica bacterium RBG_13_46_9]
MCKGLVSDNDIDIISQTESVGLPVSGKDHPTLRRWRVFDTMLRNELVKVRAARKKVNPDQYLHADMPQEVALTHTVINAQRNPSLLEGEGTLDRERWRVLDELASGHYFDLDFLIVYAQKLAILERWERILTAAKTELMEEALKKG